MRILFFVHFFEQNWIKLLFTHPLTHTHARRLHDGAFFCISISSSSSSSFTFRLCTSLPIHLTQTLLLLPNPLGFFRFHSSSVYRFSPFSQSSFPLFSFNSMCLWPSWLAPFFLLLCHSFFFIFRSLFLSLPFALLTHLAIVIFRCCYCWFIHPGPEIGIFYHQVAFDVPFLSLFDRFFVFFLAFLLVYRWFNSPISRPTDRPL